MTGILPIENGGTGANTLAGFIDNVIGAGKTYYVDGTNGDDTNAGTQAHPFKTLTHAIGVSPYLAQTLIYAQGSFTENITVPFGKYIQIIANGNITMTGYITVSGGRLYLSDGNANNTVLISSNNSTGTIYVTNGGLVILTSTFRTNNGISLINGHTSGYGIYAANASCVIFTTGTSGSHRKYTITAYNGICSENASNVTYLSSDVTISATNNLIYMLGMINNKTSSSS